MKNITALALLLVCVLTCLHVFTGCDPSRHALDIDELLRSTVKVELVEYINENPKHIKNLNGRHKPTFDFNKVTPIATLDDSQIEDLIHDLGEYEYLYFNRTLNEPIGKTLILHQINGNMLVLFGCIYESENDGTFYYGGCIMFDKDGKYIEYIGDFGYAGMEKLETKYFSTSKSDNTP
ncbi:MAG: hypothetical protein E7644_01375 [Ruminococcaceae bacterium]|nr:hypothetical protein [Oscillospiraceae bacterium]